MTESVADPELSPAPSARGEAPRIRFVGMRTDHSPSGRCRAQVELQRTDGTRVVGCREGEPTALGDLRAVAAAAIAALHDAATTGHRFELIGAKSLRAFDQTVVLVQLAVVAGPGPERLVGCAFGDADVLRATVLAVLNATNRVLWSPMG